MRQRDVLWTLATVVILAVLGALLVLLWFWSNQERVTFQPERGPFPAPPPSARRIEYRAADGQPLFAYVVGPADAARTVIVFHGNADLAVRQLDWADELVRRTGCRVMVVEYRGYAGLPGRPTYDGSRLDAAAAWEAARRALGARPGETVLFGHSLGSAIAAELAAEMRAGDGPRALVLQSPLQSARAMARVIAGPAMESVWGGVARIHYDTEARVKHLDAPVWVAHGERDFVIPARMGRAVFAAARTRGELLVVPRAGHNDVAEVAGEAYWRWLAGAVAR